MTLKMIRARAEGRDFIRVSAGWYDDGDPYGECMALMFHLNEAWYLGTGSPWPGFRPSVMLDGTAVDPDTQMGSLFGAVKAGIITSSDMLYWTTVLDRFERMIVKAGRDY
jgi:hypothetical protein